MSTFRSPEWERFPTRSSKADHRSRTWFWVGRAIRLESTMHAVANQRSRNRPGKNLQDQCCQMFPGRRTTRMSTNAPSLFHGSCRLQPSRQQCRGSKSTRTWRHPRRRIHQTFIRTNTTAPAAPKRHYRISLLVINPAHSNQRLRNPNHVNRHFDRSPRPGRRIMA